MLRFLARELHSWRVMHASSNGLVRRGDRLETATLVMLWLAAAAGMMIALTIGGDTYAAHKAAAEHQEPRHSVSATIIRTPGQGSAQSGGGADADLTTVAWQDPNGHRLTAAVSAEPLDSVGRVRVVWLDDSGSVVDPPVTTTDAVMEGLIAGAAVGMLVVLGWWGSTVLVRMVADQHRSRRWDAEWRQFDIDSHP
ncbi:Rv1733c family protein [Gordonia terrae]|uniref:Transmembrane protein n=1 Tax=Gordonia terrae TaxID=2055 RepID=A0A2I1R8Y4_9ACTN|nr:hypothetical protein [Gordonia terrae]PKZ65597.1 hypothetical protein CYJ73_10995 [Gordonia terrae]